MYYITYNHIIIYHVNYANHSIHGGLGWYCTLKAPPVKYRVTYSHRHSPFTPNTKNISHGLSSNS